MNKDIKQFYNKESGREQRSELSAGAHARVKEKIFSNLSNAASDEPAAHGILSRLGLFKLSFAIAPLALILLVGGFGIASADALPGDTLYSVKRGFEKARLVMSPTDESKIELQTKYAEERLEELGKMESETDDASAVDLTAEGDDTAIYMGNSKESGQLRGEERAAEVQLRNEVRQEARQSIEEIKEVKEQIERKSEGKDSEDRVKNIDEKVKQLERKLERSPGRELNNSPID